MANFQMRSLVLPLVALLGWLPEAFGHAYVHYPKSRNMMTTGYPCTWCFNIKNNFASVTTQHPQTGSGGYVAAPQDFAKGLCGSEAMLGIDAGEKQTFKAGTDMPVVIVYNAQHGGNMDFRLCRRRITKEMGAQAAAECLDEVLLHRQCVPDCGCDSDRCRSNPNNNDENLPVFRGRKPMGMEHGADEIMVPIPSDIECETCTIQWFWTTAWGEQFWNCFDVKIEGTGGPRPSPLPVPSPVPRPVAMPIPSPTGKPDCEYWCHLPPITWDRKCTWSVCQTCSSCVGAEPEPESEPESGPEAEPDSEPESEPHAEAWHEGECPLAYEQVESEGECKSAATSLGFTFTAKPSAKRAPGCSAHKSDSRAWWNTNQTGVMHRKWNRVLCKPKSLLLETTMSSIRSTKFSHRIQSHVAVEVPSSGDVTVMK